MGRERQQEDDEAPGAPEWMVTFSDCMTLLLTFFVLLLSFSSFDEKVFKKLRIIFSEHLPAVTSDMRESKDAFLPVEQIKPTEDLGEGSEKPTLERGREDNLKEETEPSDFYSRKVFLISSNEIFWGKGTVISLQGRGILSTIGSFLREVPSRVVVGENGREDKKSSKSFGLPRAWAVMEYLTRKQGLDKERFSISAASTVEGFGDEAGSPIPEVERVLEIVLLERSIYN